MLVHDHITLHLRSKFLVRRLEQLQPSLASCLTLGFCCSLAAQSLVHISRKRSGSTRAVLRRKHQVLRSLRVSTDRARIAEHYHRHASSPSLVGGCAPDSASTKFTPCRSRSLQLQYSTSRARNLACSASPDCLGAPEGSKRDYFKPATCVLGSLHKRGARMATA